MAGMSRQPVAPFDLLNLSGLLTEDERDIQHSVRAMVTEHVTPHIADWYEQGTLPYELMAGTTAAIDFLAGLASRPEAGRRDRLVESMTAVEQYEDRLRQYLEDGLGRLPGLTLRSRAGRRTPTLLVTFERHAEADAYRFLAERGVNAPAGSFYALEASRQLGLGDLGGLRIGLAPYNTVEDADRLMAGLADFLTQRAG